MKHFLLICLLASGGCRQEPAGNLISEDLHPRGDERASSIAAQQAVDVVRQYFALIGARKYADARLLWGNEGADSKSDDLTFANSFAGFSEYHGEVDNPTEIKLRDGVEYIAVQTKLRIRLKKYNEVSDRDGAVLLKRTSRAGPSTLTQSDWRIWAIDLRPRH